MKVEKIKGNPTIINRRDSLVKKLRVAAYCRVSTDTEDQMNSYNSQREYYNDLIKKNEEYEFVGIYADPGISGTSAEKREEFQRMMADAKDKKIDLILTKSISRFARNTLDTLKYVRMLKEIGVAVKFEEENINTVSMDGELLLTILSSVAQQEVQNISANVKKGLDMKMQRGELIGFNGCLGYDYHSDTKTLTINPEEAKIVKYIFKRYSEGIGCRVISRELMEIGYKTKKGNKRWSDVTVRDVLKNVKYKGDLVLGKTFTLDPISKKRLDNLGESNMYYIKDHHEAIIDPDTFELVQEIMKKKKLCFKRRTPDETETRVPYQRKYAFTGMLYCSYCGSRLFKRVLFADTKHEKSVWNCTNHIRNGAEFCPDSRSIEHHLIEEAFVKAFNMMAKTNVQDIDDFIEEVSVSLNGKDFNKQLNEINDQLNRIEKKKSNLMEMRADDMITKEELYDRLAPLNKELEDLKKEKAELDAFTSTKNSFKEKALEFKRVLSNTDLLDSFDRTIFEASVERVIIGSKEDSNGITIVFKPEYTPDGKTFEGKYNKINHNTATYFCVNDEDESKQALEYINANIKELFSFSMKYEHFTFIPSEVGNRKNKVQKYEIPVHVMMTANI